jgi:hypothetical protein
MLNNTQLRKSGNPARGSIFFMPRNCGDGRTSGCGHVGFVERVDGNIIHTLEGNTGGPAGVYRRNRNITTAKFTFIHVEDLDTVENNINALLEPFNLTIDDKKLWAVAGVAAATIVGVAWWNRSKKRGLSDYSLWGYGADCETARKKYTAIDKQYKSAKAKLKKEFDWDANPSANAIIQKHNDAVESKMRDYKELTGNFTKCAKTRKTLTELKERVDKYCDTVEYYLDKSGYRDVFEDLDDVE